MTHQIFSKFILCYRLKLVGLKEVIDCWFSNRGFPPVEPHPGLLGVHALLPEQRPEYLPLHDALHEPLEAEYLPLRHLQCGPGGGLGEPRRGEELRQGRLQPDDVLVEDVLNVAVEGLPPVRHDLLDMAVVEPQIVLGRIVGRRLYRITETALPAVAERSISADDEANAEARGS